MKRVLVTGIELMVDVDNDWTVDDVTDRVVAVKKMLDMNADSDVTILGANDIHYSDIEEIAE